MQLESLPFKVDSGHLRENMLIEGLFLMGSRAEDDYYPEDLSDIDCCAIVSRPIEYRILYGTLNAAFRESSRLEICPRTILQLKAKNKFNYDLKYLSKILYIRNSDIRSEIPEINLADFSRIDVCSPLFSALEFFMEAFYEYFRKTDRQRFVILLEKSLRKLSLYINLRHNIYPIYRSTRYSILETLYSQQSQVIKQLSLFRQNMNYQKIDIYQSVLALMFMLNSELQILFRNSTLEQMCLADTLVDKEHRVFAKSLLEIFFNICNDITAKKNDEQLSELEVVEGYLLSDYHCLIADDSFLPPTIVNGGYHVFK